MPDDLTAPSDGPNSIRPELQAHDEPQRPDHPTGQPVADREVPIPAVHYPSLLNQWLDGDVPMEAAKSERGGGDAVDLWTKINDEAEVLRSRTTPLYVHKRIMDSLPADTYKKPWYRRAVAMTPLALVAAAAALVGVGAIVARLALR